MNQLGGLSGVGQQSEDVLDSFGRLMRALHFAKGTRPSPWVDCPLTLPQLRALSLLAARGQGLIGRELAIRLGVGPSAITPLVDRLVEHGYVARQEDRDDRRATRLIVTETGLDVLQRLIAGQRDLMRDVLGHLDADELHTVGDAFAILLRGVDRVIAADAARGNDSSHELTSGKDSTACATHLS